MHDSNRGLARLQRSDTICKTLVGDEMRQGTFLSIAVLGLSMAVSAQEGFPLDGTWRGDWGTAPDDRMPVVLVMKWDGSDINGMINPGPDSASFTQAVLNPDAWTVRIEAQARDDAGNPVTIVVDGRLGNIGSYNRTLEGTWRRGDVEGDFRIARE